MTDEASSNVCFLVSYSGHVQGVGFRWTTAKIARRHNISGFVRNLPDGKVELVAHGRNAAVTAFLADVASTLDEYIARMETTEATFQDDLAGFEIRR